MGAPEQAGDEPVYDERGNVRPRGTEGARPMSFEERAEIAARLASYEGPALAEPAERKPRRTKRSEQ